jgi:hypothetical protein
MYLFLVIQSICVVHVILFKQVLILYIACAFHEFCHIFVCSQLVKLSVILKIKTKF